MEPLTSPELRALAEAAGCNLTKSDRHLGDCVIRAIGTGRIPKPVSPCSIAGGIGTLTIDTDGAAEFIPTPGTIPWGDWLHAFAHPLANLADRTFGTKLADCGGCAGRRRRMNGNPMPPPE